MNSTAASDVPEPIKATADPAEFMGAMQRAEQAMRGQQPVPTEQDSLMDVLRITQGIRRYGYAYGHAVRAAQAFATAVRAGTSLEDAVRQSTVDDQHMWFALVRAGVKIT